MARCISVTPIDAGPVWDCLIVGGGQAGGWVAAGLRENGFSGSIALLGEEQYPPYERPPLSKQILTGEQPVEAAHLRPAAFYEENGIALRLGRRVTGLDTADHLVTTAEGESYRYRKLVIATGARARRLAVSGDGAADVHYLRGIADMLALRPRLRDGVRLAIIGGGFVGLEVAASAVKLGANVTVLETGASLLKRMSPPVLGAEVRRLHERHGVSFRFGARTLAVEGSLAGHEIVLADGETIAADIVLAGIGATPNVELAVAGGLAVDNGIRVDAYGRTSDPDVFAAGDVTNHFNPLFGCHLRLQSWQNAQNQALAVARVLTGGQAPYAEVPWVWSDQYDANLQFAGMPNPWAENLVRGDPKAGAFSVFSLVDGCVVSVCAYNAGKDVAAGKRLIVSRRQVDPGRLCDSGADLRRVVGGS